MQKTILRFLLTFVMSVGCSLNAQTADGGIFASGNSLLVKFKPNGGDITGSFTSGNFGIRWLSSLGSGVTLSGETGSFGYSIQPPGKLTSGSYDYIVYASGSSIGSTTYTSGTEYTLMTVTVTGGAGTGDFELCPGGFGITADWYIEIDGVDKANPSSALWYYQATVANVPLPVELTSFTASVNENVVNLNWQTTTEVDNYGFNIEKRINEGDWNTIGFIEGHGNSTSPKEYSYTDKDLFAGGSKFQYRLKQLDTDGSFEYSDVVEVDVLPTQFELSQNYPNPFNPSTTIRFSLPKETKLKINIYNMLGELVETLAQGTYEAGYHKVTFNAFGLASGAYIYRIESADFVQVKKMILLR